MEVTVVGTDGGEATVVGTADGGEDTVITAADGALRRSGSSDTTAMAANGAESNDIGLEWCGPATGGAACP